MAKMTIKSPARLIAVALGTFALFLIDYPLGWAFLFGTFVGSVKFETRPRPHDVQSGG